MYPYVVVMASRFIGCGNTHRLDYARNVNVVVRTGCAFDIRYRLMFQFQHSGRNGFNPLDDEGRQSKVKYYLVLPLNAFGEADNFAILQRDRDRNGTDAIVQWNFPGDQLIGKRANFCSKFFMVSA